MFRDKAINKGIISSLIASIVFIIILQPLMNIVWDFLNRTSSNVYTNYLDSLYKNAALGHRNYIDFIILTSVVAALIGLLFLSYSRLSLAIRRVKTENELSRIKNFEEKKDYINKEKQKMLVKVSFITKWFFPFKIFNFCFIFFALFMFSTGLFKIYADIQLNTSFNQRMNALAPYVNETQTKELFSKWAMMKTKVDFLEIKKLIEEIAEKNNIELPEELMK